AAASLYFAWRYLQATVDLRAIGAIFGASALGYAAMLLLSYLALPSLLALVADVLAFLFVYLTAAPLVGAIDVADVETLGAAFEGLGVLSDALQLILRYELLVLRRLRPG